MLTKSSGGLDENIELSSDKTSMDQTCPLFSKGFRAASASNTSAYTPTADKQPLSKSKSAPVCHPLIKASIPTNHFLFVAIYLFSSVLKSKHRDNLLFNKGASFGISLVRYPCTDSNCALRLRRPTLCPLSYRGGREDFIILNFCECQRWRRRASP